MKKYFRKVFFMLFDLFTSLLVTWIIHEKVSKYMDYLFCGQTETCKPKMIDCSLSI